MLSCNGLILNYAVVLYDKSTSKIRIVQDIAGELPVPLVRSYFLCDSWYTSKDVMAVFRERGFLAIDTVKTKRIIFPVNIKMSIRDFALRLRIRCPFVRLVIVGGRRYYVYRYRGKLNDGVEGVVLITYPKALFASRKPSVHFYAWIAVRARGTS